jgi:hypothetical protein
VPGSLVGSGAEGPGANNYSKKPMPPPPAVHAASSNFEAERGAPQPTKAPALASPSFSHSSPLTAAGADPPPPPPPPSPPPPQPAAAAPARAAAAPAAKPSFTSYRDRQYVRLLLDSEVVDSEGLKKLAWNGVPGRWRPEVWQLLLAYLPADKKRRETTLRRKRQEYADAVASHFDAPEASFDRTIQEQKMLRQILVDVPRTSPEVSVIPNS